MKFWRCSFFALVAVAAATSAAAQDPVPDLQGMIGARGSAVDSLSSRGYTYDRTDKSATASYSYWRHDASGRCIVARVENGEVASIVYSDGDCKEPDPDEGFFETVCGVIRDGQKHSYRCKAKDDVGSEGGRRTFLRFPDQEMVLHWHLEDNVSITRSGLAAQQATFSVRRGETSIVLPEMTYFYISDLDRAAREIRNFKD